MAPKVSPDFTRYDPSLGAVDRGAVAGAAAEAGADGARVEAAGVPGGVVASPGEVGADGAVDGLVVGADTEGAVGVDVTATGGTTGASARSEGGSSSTVYSRITRPVAQVNSTIRSRYGSLTGDAELMRTK